MSTYTLWNKLLNSKSEITKAGIYIQKERSKIFVFTEEIAFHKFNKVQVFFCEV